MNTKRLLTEKLISSLWKRWPDSELLENFHILLLLLRQRSKTLSKFIEDHKILSVNSFEDVCQCIIEVHSKKAIKNGHKFTLGVVDDFSRLMKATYKSNSKLLWIQYITSALGMLMHFSLCEKSPGVLINKRRPKKAFSTYPTSPHVAHLLANYALSHLLKEPVPSRCRNANDAERYAKRSLNFRILDPSMESGQFLLEVALSLVHSVYNKHSPSSKEAVYLNRALLEYLCANCFWGIDRNPRAITAVTTVFSVLANEIGIPNLSIRNLIVANSIKYFNDNRLPQFDGVLNNPPWEKLTDCEDQTQIKQFKTVEHWKETYVAFTELSIRCLRPGGIFAFILPSQSIATRNSSRMRSMLLNNSHIDHLMILPRTAFADATVRGLVVLGRTKPAYPPSKVVWITKYPIIKRFDAKGTVTLFKLPIRDLEQLGNRPWSRVLNNSKNSFSNLSSVKLEQVSTVLSGVKLYCKGRGQPPQTSEIVLTRPFSSYSPFPGAVPAVRGRDIIDFQLKKPKTFVKFGSWLAQIGQHSSFFGKERVLVRELCRRDGKLNAAVATERIIPLHGVLTIVPEMISAQALVSILNSRIAAEYVRHNTASFSKVDFQKITVGELKQMPIPIALIGSQHRRDLGINEITNREVKLQKRLTTLVFEITLLLSSGTTNIYEFRERIEGVIEELYVKRKEGKNA